ncbi:MAG: hypothetical protein WCG23_07590 [bacterium]
MNYDEILEYLKKKKLQKHINKLAKTYKNKKVLIYGAGLFFNVIQENYDLSILNIVAISDNKFEKEEQYKGIKAIPPYEIKNADFDVMIIATFEPEYIEDYAQKDLYPECGKFKIDSFNNYNLKDFIGDVIACFS